MKMALIIESTLFRDAQDTEVAGYCPVCGDELYRPSMECTDCARRPFLPLTALAESYRASAIPLRQRLRQLRQMLETTQDPEEIWHIKRRIAELTPMLTQMNELAELTEHYYDRGYWRNEKYTL